MSQRQWSLAWSTWLCATVGSFGVLEYIAIRRQSHPTLSATLRRWMGVEPKHRLGKFLVGAWMAFWAGLTIHIIHVAEENRAAS